jgi:hypothetical protein
VVRLRLRGACADQPARGDPLVLLSIIMVGQKVASAKSDRQLEQTYKDAEELLKISDQIHCLLKQNTDLTQEINQVMRDAKKA